MMVQSYHLSFIPLGLFTEQFNSTTDDRKDNPINDFMIINYDWMTNTQLQLSALFYLSSSFEIMNCIIMKLESEFIHLNYDTSKWNSAMKTQNDKRSQLAGLGYILQLQAKFLFSGTIAFSYKIFLNRAEPLFVWSRL